jgi:D-alanine-D-alanine ligase
MGGHSSEREVSLNSAQNVYEALQRGRYQAECIDGVPALIDALSAKRIDRVFNIMHGAEGENGVVPGLCQAHGIKCTGSGVLGSALTLDKIRTKQVWLAAGLPTPAYVRIQNADEVKKAANQLGFPLIVKPSLEGSSVGVSRVFKESELSAAIDLARRYAGELLMEALIVGKELTVGIIGGETLPSIHIVPAGQYYDYHAKYTAEDTQYHCPGLQGDAESHIRALAKQAFDLAGATGWGRVDVMQDSVGQFWLLEVNTTPGMTSHSLVPKAARSIGIEFDELVARILGTSEPLGYPT